MKQWEGMAMEWPFHTSMNALAVVWSIMLHNSVSNQQLLEGRL
jgi:hypothetical protein